MEKLGYGHLTEIKGVAPLKNPIGNYTKMKEMSNGKRYHDWSLGINGVKN